jgi:hypothetical protein
MHDGAFAPPPSATPPPGQGRSATSTILAVLAVLVLAGLGSCVACVVWLGTGPESGVRMANQVEPYALTYLQEHGLLQGSEKLIVYYDVTLEMDGSESAFVTTERVVYDQQGRTTAMRLAEVTDVESSDEGLIGDVIDITAKSGDRMRIEIAPLNDGPLFVRELRRAIDRAQTPPDVDVRVVPTVK